MGRVAKLAEGWLATLEAGWLVKLAEGCVAKLMLHATCYMYESALGSFTDIPQRSQIGDIRSTSGQHSVAREKCTKYSLIEKFCIRKSKLPAKTTALNTNIFFHPGAFLLPLDGGIFNRFTCCFIQVYLYMG